MVYLSGAQMQIKIAEDDPREWRVVEVLHIGAERWAVIDEHKASLDVIQLEPEKIVRMPESYWHDRLVFLYEEEKTHKNVKTIPGTYRWAVGGDPIDDK